MAADLSALSTEDLVALKGGDLSKVSTAGLQALKGLQSGPSAAERVATDPISTGARATAGATPAELIAGSSPGRFLLEPARGLLELGSHLGLPGGESAQQTGELIKRGRAAYDNTGLDIAGIAGQVASPAVLKAGKLIPAGANLLQKSLGSAATGATAGALTPTEDKGDFWKEKGMQTWTGAALGAALPPAGALAKGLFSTVYKAFEPIIPGGPEAILGRFQDKLLGPAKQKVAQALAAARELVPGSKPTAGEAVAGIPEASALAAHQKAVSTSPAVSGEFVKRAGEQEGARAAAIGDIAKTPADLAAAEAARAGEAATNYGRAFQVPPSSTSLLKELGDLQRGAPESAMLKIQDTMGGGVLNPVVEHAGDLIHRMSHHAEYGTAYPGLVNEKASRVLHYLEHPYGFAKELEENIVANAGARGIAPEAFRQKIVEGLKNYANAHNALPAYNAPQDLAKQASVAIGEMRWDDARKALHTLKTMSADGLAFEKAALAVRPLEGTIQSDPTLAKLAEDPFFKRAIPDAIDLAASKGINAKDNLTQFLHYVKVGLDKQLSRTGDTALASTEKEAVQGVKAKLTAWMDEKNPAYATARARFSDMSKPINQMQVGQGLQEKLAAPLGTQERAASYASAVRSPESLIKAEVGGPSRSLADILTPEQLGAVNAVGSDLGRKAQFERLARGTNLGGTGMQPENLLPNLLSRPAMVANYVAKKLGHNLEDRVTTLAGRQYLNPQELAAALADKPLSVRKRLIDELLQRTGYPIVSGAPAAAVAQQY